ITRPCRPAGWSSAARRRRAGSPRSSNYPTTRSSSLASSTRSSGRGRRARIRCSGNSSARRPSSALRAPPHAPPRARADRVTAPTASRVAWAGDYLRVEVETWPGIGDYEVIHKHDAVAIAPITPEGDVVLVRQFRPPVRDALLEVPAGLLDIDG